MSIDATMLNSIAIVLVTIALIAHVLITMDR
jgi:hypothetical protein